MCEYIKGIKWKQKSDYYWAYFCVKTVHEVRNATTIAEMDLPYVIKKKKKKACDIMGCLPKILSSRHSIIIAIDCEWKRAMQLNSREGDEFREARRVMEAVYGEHVLSLIRI